MNSGLYVGYCSALLEMYDEMCMTANCEDQKLDDQRMLMSLCLSSSSFFDKNIKIDKQSLLFLNITPKDLNETGNNLYRPEKNRIVITETGIEAAFVHGPGNTSLESILRIYGYNPEEQDHRGNNYFILAAGSYSKFFWPELLIFSIIIVFLIAMAIVLIRKRMKNKKMSIPKESHRTSTSSRHFDKTNNF